MAEKKEKNRRNVRHDFRMGFFVFWFGMWLSPQDRFVIPFYQDVYVQSNLAWQSISLISDFLPLFITGFCFGVKGVIQTSLRVAETHRAERVAASGVYSIVRHPQYLGGILAHVGFSFLLSGCILCSRLLWWLRWFVPFHGRRKNELAKEFGQNMQTTEEGANANSGSPASTRN